MSRAGRLALRFALLLGIGAVGGVALPAIVAGDPPPGDGLGSRGSALAFAPLPTPTDATADSTQGTAIQLLARAAAAGQNRTYSGTQFLSSWSTAGTSSVVVAVQHVPGRGVLVRLSGRHGSTVVDDTAGVALDPRALAVLQRHYSVSVATHDGHCAGRTARIIEVRRPARSGSTVAGRFWVDATTGLVLRRELYDQAGRTVRAAAFIDVRMAAPDAWSAPASSDVDEPETTLAAVELDRLRDAGWIAPDQLPGGLELFDARKGGGVLHLSYTDGLFAVSVFTQHGRLNPTAVKGWKSATLSGRSAWVQPGLSQRVVWGRDGWVYTAVADAPDATVSASVAGFSPSRRESFPHRVWRGLSRMESWVDPKR